MKVIISGSGRSMEQESRFGSACHRDQQQHNGKQRSCGKVLFANIPICELCRARKYPVYVLARARTIITQTDRYLVSNVHELYEETD